MKAKTKLGSPTPLGPTLKEKGVNFAIFSKHAKRVWLCIEWNDHTEEISLDPQKNRTGDIWHIFIENLSFPCAYSYRFDGPHEKPHFFHPHAKLIDPYAKRIAFSHEWKNCRKEKYHPKGYLKKEEPFDWKGTSHPHLPWQDLIIYEAHVRGFTIDPSSETKHPGTFLALIEKIPYLKKLGVNAIELMPIQEFNECGYSRNNPETHEPLCNFWGYSTIQFFSPMNRYATNYEKCVEEFKTLTRELHKEGIEVIIDIVFNHTGEKSKEEGFYSFMGIDHSVYYMLKNQHHCNYTGCGHTMNVSHPVLRGFIKECLHYWVTEMHVDGFRFDLASVMNRDIHGKLLQPSALVEMITKDPLLSKTKLIAEPWDIEAFQLGGFYPEEIRWSEWNGKYRDCMRRFIKGDQGFKQEFAAKICGSRDLFSMRSPQASINFITAHDGFTLQDLVSYNQKRNEMNGEHNRDGNSSPFSWNCGHEGPTNDEKIIHRREKQKRNLILALFLSQGIPMILMGDEYGHTKNGNNNTWCQDNALNWFQWGQESHWTEFLRKMIQFRKDHEILRRESFFSDQDIEWHGIHLNDPNWDDPIPILAFKINDPKGEHLYAAFNATGHAINFQIPPPDAEKKWHKIVNTALKPPQDCLIEKLEDTAQYSLEPYSSILLKLQSSK